MVPIKKGINGESTCACGIKIPSRIATGIKMARRFFIAGCNLENYGPCLNSRSALPLENIKARPRRGAPFRGA